MTGDRLRPLPVLIVGILLVAVGATAFVWTFLAADDAVIADGTWTWIEDHEGWWPVVAAGGVLVVLVGFLWLRSLLRNAATAPLIDVRHDGESTVVDLRAAADGMAAAAERIPGVADASAIADSAGRIDLRLTIRGTGDLALVRRRIEREVLRPFARMLDDLAVATRVVVSFGSSGGRVS